MAGNVIIGGTATGATALPAASTIDGTLDLLPIYTASATATQAINRSTFLGVSGTPADISSSQSFSNKTLANSTVANIKDSSLSIQSAADATKIAKFSASSITTGNTRTYTLPDLSDTLVTLTATQTLTNKTFTSPTINAPTITNATISADAIIGYTVSNTGTIYGIGITTGQISTASSILPTALATGVSYTKFFNNYKFSVYRNAAFTAANGSPGLITFDTNSPAPTAFDTGSNYSTSTAKFTAPVNGFYLFSASVQSNITSGYSFATLYKNGSEVLRGTQINGSFVAGNGVSGLLQLSAGDYIQVYYQGTGGSGTPGSNYTYFQGFLMSAT
jgi:hypothetical protein